MSHPLPSVDVAVTVIARDALLLAVYNPSWGGFTLPMTKRRQFHANTKVPLSAIPEVWADAAARAAAEWLGRIPKLEFLHEIEEFSQSDRDGDWKVYHFQVFRMPAAEPAEPVTGTITEWLSHQTFLTERRITPTARKVVSELRDRGLLPPWSP